MAISKVSVGRRDKLWCRAGYLLPFPWPVFSEGRLWNLQTSEYT